MKFLYQARTKTGEVKAGTIESSSRSSAGDALKKRGLYVTFIEEKKTPFYASDLKFLQRIKKKEIVIFSRQLAIMFKSKVPLVEILQTLGKQTKNPKFKEVILKMAGEVEGGASLSGVLSKHPNLFSPFYINMVKSGESSGKLVDVFLYLADYLEKEETLKGKVKGALIYPAFIIFVFVAVITVIVVFVIPQLVEILEDSGEELPFLTKVVIWGSDFARTKGWIFLLVFVAAVFGFIKWIRTDTGKRIFDTVKIKIPVLGGLLKKVYLSRIALSLSTLISGGLPIAVALNVSGKVVGNTVYEDIVKMAEEDVNRGEPISHTFERYPKEISPFFHQMIIVGEKTGTIDSSLMNVVSFYEREVDRDLTEFIKLIEPALIMSLGLVVGGLMAAILIPIYSISMA